MSIKKERKEITLALLKTPEKNTRIHPEKQINEIRRSLRKPWGQYKNIVVDENNFILAGNAASWKIQRIIRRNYTSC